MRLLLVTLYVIGLYGAYIAGAIYSKVRPAQSPRTRPQTSHFPKATLFLLLLVMVPTTLQFFFPVVFSLLERNYTRFLDGEWWRLITPLLVQDGGVGGAIFNLVSLLLVGMVAEQFWSNKQILLIFFIGGMVGELVAFVWQPVGAGNSVGNFSLAASVAVALLMRHLPKPVLLAALFSLVADGVLVVLLDIHGAAATAGAILAFVLLQQYPGKGQQSEKANYPKL